MVAAKKAAPDGANIGSGKGNNHKANIAQAQGEINGKFEGSLSLFQIRRGGTVICESHIRNLGYSAECLKDMARAGLHLYRDGKRVKLCDIT